MRWGGLLCGGTVTREMNSGTPPVSQQSEKNWSPGTGESAGSYYPSDPGSASTVDASPNTLRKENIEISEEIIGLSEEQVESKIVEIIYNCIKS